MDVHDGFELFSSYSNIVMVVIGIASVLVEGPLLFSTQDAAE
jgi:hypothetical protein